MKELVFTYDTAEHEKGQKITGETCKVMRLSELALENLKEYGEHGIIYEQVEKVLEMMESLMGREYIQGSIKSYQYDTEEWRWIRRRNREVQGRRENAEPPERGTDERVIYDLESNAYWARMAGNAEEEAAWEKAAEYARQAKRYGEQGT